MKNKTKLLVVAGILAALSIIFTRFLSVMLLPEIRIGIGAMPIMLSGILLGPIAGGATGIVADLIGVLINPQGIFHLGFTLSSMLTGLIPGIIFFVFKKYIKNEQKAIIISVVIVMILIDICLNTYWLTGLLGKGMLALLPIRLLKAVINNFIIVVILEGLYPFVKRWKM